MKDIDKEENSGSNGDGANPEVILVVDCITGIEDADYETDFEDGSETMAWRMYTADATVYMRGSKFEEGVLISVAACTVKVSVHPQRLWATVCVMNRYSILQLDPLLIEVGDAVHQGVTLGEIISAELESSIENWKTFFAGKRYRLSCTYLPDTLPPELSVDEFEELYALAIQRILPESNVNFDRSGCSYSLDGDYEDDVGGDSSSDWIEFLVFETLHEMKPELRFYNWLPVTRYASQYAFAKLVAKARGWASEA